MRPIRERAHVNATSPFGSRGIASCIVIGVVSIGSESRVLTRKG